MLPLVRKTLPIGIQTFAKIREGDCYYVDKTAYALRLAKAAGYYFLSRPRRFGKSLFLDTLKELFEGNQALFSGLLIADQWDWNQRFPVLRISFGGGVVSCRADVREMLHRQFDSHERQFGLPARFPDLASRFADLIVRLHEKTAQRVVVLVDEYDKPILDRLEQPDSAREIREELKNIYSVIKDQDAHIRFAMLTGVSRFSKVSLFSGLNNLEDITLDPEWSALCGYTGADVDTVFAPELDGLEREQIKRWFNGYNWGGESVYNPFDLLMLFKKRKFKAYWFETGTPTFLVKLLAERGFFAPDLASLCTDEALLSTFDIEHISLEALLFQTGYLTIIATDEPDLGMLNYTLGYPNLEVETSLNNSLLALYTNDASKNHQHGLQLRKVLRNHDLTGLRQLIHAFFAGIPHQWYSNNPIAQYEGFYASVFYSHFAALGLDVRVEDATNHGRIDMAVLMPDTIFLFEFKVVELLPNGAALQQLKDKRYAEKYTDGRPTDGRPTDGRPVFLIGVEFSREARNVVGFEVEQSAH